MFGLVLPPHWERPGVLAGVASPGSLWHPGHGGHGQGAEVSKLLWERLWDLETNLSERVTCGERLLPSHTKTGILGK